MISPELIARYYSINHNVLHMQVEGLTHEDSLIQPPFRANNLNWVLGHIVSSRGGALKLLGAEPVWSKEEAASYARESEPLTDTEQAYPLEKILADLDETQERLEAALAGLTIEDMEQAKGDRTLGERLSFSYWHEAYHTGQTELLRQVSGVDDKVI
jgi:uncharacterized damage-inducible protein DinB